MLAFATHLDHVRRGSGRLIYHQGISAATLAGVTRFQAYSSLAALAFYASVGLEVVRHFHLPLGAGVTLSAALMEGQFQAGA